MLDLSCVKVGMKFRNVRDRFDYGGCIFIKKQKQSDYYEARNVKTGETLYIRRDPVTDKITEITKNADTMRDKIQQYRKFQKVGSCLLPTAWLKEKKKLGCGKESIFNLVRMGRQEGVAVPVSDFTAEDHTAYRRCQNGTFLEWKNGGETVDV